MAVRSDMNKKYPCQVTTTMILLTSLWKHFRLERKYKKIDTWPRPERKLLFDLANSVLSEIPAPCIRGQQEELAVGHPDYQVLDPEWLKVGCVAS
ncbi:hypothetical protein E2562_013964 [Oryza meyeriana var. granulata]|uniref:DUF4378 domain-containing protein n=1 Tax=Oryza meyeriana var. granulata TaxID=110450 RepID=A0A6G1DKM9_9ORYZ|nr:hypothetical protein E2562_013964 [Oryza meyeriana var. granulata]